MDAFGAEEKKTMRIHHVAIWTIELDKMRDFYVKYFNATTSKLYQNKEKKFRSYFLSFEDGSNLELMNMPSILVKNESLQQYIGLIHIAFSVGNEQNVNNITERLINDGYQIVSKPRWTGDGYYESCFLDPENNRLEITI